MSACNRPKNADVLSDGDTMSITIQPNERLINVQWLNSNLWALTEDTLTHTFYFREKSAFGKYEGIVIITNK